MCEEFDVESVWAVEHVVVAEDYEPRYPYSPDGRMPGRPGTVMPDPLEWLTYFAAVTETVRLGTSVMVLPLHSPAVLAKRVATLDCLSRGRAMMLGVGIGWQVEEYAAVGVPYDDRGPRLEEYVDAMRELWREDVATYHGLYVDFERVSSLPKPAQPDGVPIVIGGSSRVAARRGRAGSVTASSPTSSRRTTSSCGSRTCVAPPSRAAATPMPSRSAPGRRAGSPAPPSTSRLPAAMPTSV